MKILLSFLVSTFCLFIAVISQSSDTPPPAPSNGRENLNPDWTYCFEFTWVGPGYDNQTRFNSTCADYLDSTRATNIPCSPPIVITYKADPPDIDYLFENHMSSVLCKKTPNQVCASYTYRYDGKVENATFMCTKVQNVGNGPITSGCYTQKMGSYETELCVCKSNPGIYKPCNGKLVTW